MLAMMWRVTKLVMARVTRVIVTNALAAAAVVLASPVVAAISIAAAATTIAQCHCPQHHPMPLPLAQPLQQQLPSPTSLTPQSNGNGIGDGKGSNGYGNKGNGQATVMVTTCAMVMATRWREMKRAMARAARAMMTVTKRAMATASRAMTMATKRAMVMDGEVLGYEKLWYLFYRYLRVSPGTTQKCMLHNSVRYQNTHSRDPIMLLSMDIVVETFLEIGVSDLLVSTQCLQDPLYMEE